MHADVVLDVRSAAKRRALRRIRWSSGRIHGIYQAVYVEGAGRVLGIAWHLECAVCQRAMLRCIRYSCGLLLALKIVYTRAFTQTVDV